MIRKLKPSLLGWQEQLDRDETVVTFAAMFLSIAAFGASPVHAYLGLTWPRAIAVSSALGLLSAWIGVRKAPAVPGLVLLVLFVLDMRRV